MDITYIFRTQSHQRSIERVFEPIIERMKASGHNVSVEFAVKKKSLLATLWTNIWHFRKVSQKQICHITGDVQYVACLMNPKHTILTIHDLVPLHNKKVPWYSKWLCYWLWYYFPLRRLKRVTCISEATRQDLISFFPWAKNKISVVTNPISPEFKFVPKDFNQNCPTILHVGTKTNKNLLRVIEALAGINCHLRVIGRIPDEEKEALNRFHINFSNEEFVTDNQIVQEYEKCDIVSFPSLFEGFGMPIIEGQTTGRAVLTSDLEPMKTVAGKNACLVDPYSVVSIRHGFLHLINDNKYRKLVALAGIENAKIYTPQSITNMYKKVYKESCIISLS